DICSLAIAAVENVSAKLEKGSLAENVFEQGRLQTADIHEVVVVVNGSVLAVSVEDAGVVGQQILLLRPNARERLSPKLNADLPIRCNCAGRQSAFDSIQRRIWSKLIQSEWRFILADHDLRCGKLMPVEPDVCARKCRAIVVGAIILAKIAFNLEIELLRKIAG